IHYRLSHILLAVAGLYLVFGLVMIGVKRGLNYRPNPTAPTAAGDEFRQDASNYVSLIDWLYDTSKNSIPLTANHTARYNPLDLQIAGVIFVVSLASIFIHKKTEVSSE